MIRNPKRLRELLAEYGRMNRLDGFDEASRGTRFNALIAEALTCWGIDATSNLRGAGEIDVAFEFAPHARQVVMEAKWTADPVDTGPVSKLQKRIRQRLVGTVGVLLSMSGFTKPAVLDLKEGEQLSVLLMTREHIEAMLAGFIPPQELIGMLVSRAARFGDAAPTVLQLFDPPDVDELGIVYGQPSEIATLVRKSIPGFRASAVAASLPFGQHGVAELEPGTLLVTSDSAILSLNLARKKTKTWLPIPNCSRNVLLGAGGVTYVVRRSGVACIRNGEFNVVAGGLCGNACLFPGTHKEPYVFANGDDDRAIPPTVTKLDSPLGDETGHEVDYPPSSGMNASQLADGRFLVTGSAGIVTQSIPDRSSVVTQELTNPMGLLAVSNCEVLVASGNVDLSLVNVSRGSVQQVAELALQGSVSELAPCATGGGYLFSHYTTDEGETKGIIVRCELPAPTFCKSE